nr:N-acetylmuramoyl-L-alanine amidase [Desulforamulus aquiferis]
MLIRCTNQANKDDDSYISLNSRAVFANNLRADLYVSIHINAGGGAGFESYIYNGPSVPILLTSEPLSIMWFSII